MTGQTAPLCDRSAAIADVGQRFGIGMQFVEDGLLGLCKAKVSDFAHFTDGVASSSCTYPSARTPTSSTCSATCTRRARRSG